MKKILLVKTSSMGDVIHNLPVVNDILQHHPQAQIDWVVEESFAEIPRLHPHINQVFTVAMRRWRKHLFSQNTWCEIKKCKRLLSQQPYDFIIDTQGLIKSAIVSTWANGARYGYDKNSIREPYASYFYQHKFAISYQHHAVVRNRALAAMSLGYAVPTDAPDYGLEKHGISTIGDLPSELQALHLGEDFFVALHGTSKESKLWPEEYWIHLGQQLATRAFTMLLPWSNQDELERAQRIAAKVNSAIVLPKLNITALAGMMTKATIAIGVDTGLSHLAAALDVPTIALYTDSNPLRTGVMAGNKVLAVNLGGKQNVPSVTEVLKKLRCSKNQVKPYEINTDSTDNIEAKMTKIKAKDLYKRIRENISTHTKTKGYKRTQGGMLGYYKPYSDKFIVFWFQADKYGWDVDWGSSFTIEFQLSEANFAGIGHNRFRIPSVLSRKDLEIMRAKNNEIISSMQGFDAPTQFYEIQGKIVSFPGKEIRRKPYSKYHDYWFEYWTFDDIDFWSNYFIQRLEELESKIISMA